MAQLPCIGLSWPLITFWELRHLLSQQRTSKYRAYWIGNSFHAFTIKTWPYSVCVRILGLGFRGLGWMMREACVKSLSRFFFIQADETRFFSSAALLRREGGALGLGDQMGVSIGEINFSHVFRIVIPCLRKPLSLRTWWCGSQTYRNPVSMNSWPSNPIAFFDG